MDSRQELTGIPAHRLGQALLQHRRARAESRGDIAERFGDGFSTSVIRMIEEGRYPLTEAQVDIVLQAYRAERDELFPIRQAIEFDDEGRYIAVGWSVRELARSGTAEDVLEEYLEFVYELRGLQAGTPLQLREEDLEVLAKTVDWPVEDVRNHLTELMSTLGAPVAGDADGEEDGVSDSRTTLAGARLGANRQGGLKARLAQGVARETLQ